MKANRRKIFTEMKQINMLDIKTRIMSNKKVDRRNSIKVILKSYALPYANNPIS